MAQKIVDFRVQPVPQRTTTATQFTLASFDVAALPGGIGNITDCAIMVRARVQRYEEGTNAYSTGWERLGAFRRDGATAPAYAGAVPAGVAGNAGINGGVGQGESAVSFLWDVSGTVCRLRCTPDSRAQWWWVRLDVSIVQAQ